MQLRLAIALTSLLSSAQIMQFLVWAYRTLPIELLLLFVLVVIVLCGIAWGEWVRWLNRQPGEYPTFKFDRYLPLVLSGIGLGLGLVSAL